MNDKVQCMICGKWYREITNTHLHTHDISCEEYRKKYPDISFCSNVMRNKMSKSRKGRKHSPETIKKMSESLKGKGLGRKHSSESIRRMSEAHKGKKLSLETRKKMSKARKGRFVGEKCPMFGRTGEEHPMYGKRHSSETRRKISQALKGENHPNYGKKYSLEYRKKLSEARKGRYGGENNPMFGRKHSAVTRRKISEALKGMFVGEKNSNYRGGFPYVPYGPGFTDSLKEEIRSFDEYRCQFCGCFQEMSGRKLDVHHINRDKDDHRLCNLVSLCHNCHMKVTNARDNKELTYKLYFQELIKNKHDIELAAS